jgi:hypothetical protein
VAIVNLSRDEPLMIGQRNINRMPGTAVVGAGVGPAVGTGLATGLLFAATAANADGNTKEFNARAPSGFAAQLQDEVTRSISEIVGRNERRVTRVEIEPTNTYGPEYAKILTQLVLAKCGDCDHAVFIDAVFGYTVGDKILTPTVVGSLLTIRFADGYTTGRVLGNRLPDFTHRDFSNVQTGHEHYHTFRDDKRDHYEPLRELVPIIVRGLSERFGQ